METCARTLARMAISCALLMACGYDGVGGLEMTPPDATAVREAGGQDAGDAGVEDAALADVQTTPGTCADPSLLLCMRFENGFVDEAHGQTVTVTGSPSFGPGMDAQAVTVDASVTIHIPDGPTWKFSTLSVEMWVKPASLPGIGDRMGLLDKDGSFGIFLFPDGSVTCSLQQTAQAVVAKVGVWVHIACVNDGSTTKLYADGLEKASIPASTVSATALSIAVAGNSPSGNPLIGSLDTLRAFARARTAAEIAAAAQR